MRFDVFFGENTTNKDNNEENVKNLLASKNPEYAYIQAFMGTDNYKQYKDLFEAKIMESPYWTFKYVADVLNHIRGNTSKPHNRWPKGEKVLAKEAYASWLYARYIIYGRWPMGEKAIFDSEDVQYKDLYTDFLNTIGYEDEDNEEQEDVIQRDLIKSRFQGKEMVALDDSIDYAAKRNKRWPQLERYIIDLHFPYYGIEYARKVIKGRWIEYENFIKKYYGTDGNHYMDDYQKMLGEIGYEDEDNEEQDNTPITRLLFTRKTNGKEYIDVDKCIEYAVKQGKRWPELELYILHAHLSGYALQYAEKVIKGRWLEYEKFLKKYYDTSGIYTLQYLDMLNKIGYSDEDNEEQQDTIQRSLFTYVDNFTGKIETDDITSLKYAIKQGKRWPRLEKYILNSYLGHGGIEYAEKVIKGRWLEYENFLNKHWKEKIPEYLDMLNKIGYSDEDNEELSFESFYTNLPPPKTPEDVLYLAKDLGERVPEYEHIIINSNDPNAPTIAYEYLKKIINKNVQADYDRVTWPEAEPVLARESDIAYRYTLYYINADKWDDDAYNDLPLTRFPLGEPEIAKDSHSAVRYAMHILKGRFPQGEKAIFRDSYEKKNYIAFLNRIGYSDEDNEELSFESYFTEAKSKVNIPPRPPTSQELIDPKSAYEYARKILKDKFPEGEEAMAKSPIYSYQYAKNILKDKFPLGEKAISRSSKYSYDYTVNVLHGRFPLGEKAIMKDNVYFINYIRDVIKGRWLDAETVIAKDPVNATYYAEKILKHRWPEAEPYIARAPGPAVHYARYVIKNRWPEAEPYIAKNDYWGYEYTTQVVKDRWLEYERYLKNDNIKNDYIRFLNSISYEDEDNEELL